MKQELIKPQHLTPGDNLGIVTLSAPEAADNPERVDRGIRYLKSLGFNIRFAKNSLSSTKTYLASDPEVLAEDLNLLFSDKSIKGIICSGGGTNANRLLPYLDYSTIRENPKIIVGMSNPTVVLNAIYAKTCLETFHGPVLVWNFGEEKVPDYTKNSFLTTTMKTEIIGEIPESGNWQFIKPGIAEGKLIGGNLWSLQSLLGTKFEPNWDNSILFWEDIAKEPRRLDAILSHFSLAGVFEKIVGMVIGELVLCDSEAKSLSVEQIILDLVKEYNFPILSGVRLGHTEEKLTLPIGITASINSEKELFSILESSVL